MDGRRAYPRLPFLSVAVLVLVGARVFAENPPTRAGESEKPAGVVLTDSVERHGITWTFREKVRAGSLRGQ
jgi:hypothetical protein